MSIALNLAAPSAIGSYADLIDEVRDMMDDDAYDTSKIDRAIRKAEAMFQRELRTPEMETSTIFAMTTESIALPVDFLEMRSIWVVGDPNRQLIGVAPATRVNTYSGRSGEPVAYSIESNLLRVAPVGNVTIEMLYYQQITPLSSVTPQNWLLDLHPDLYSSAVLYYLAIRERDSELEASSLQRTLGLLESIKVAEMKRRWGGAPLVPQGIMQVRGPRA